MVGAWLQQLCSPHHAPPSSSTPLIAPQVDPLSPCPCCTRCDTVSKRGKSRTGAQRRYHCKQCQHDFTQNVHTSGPGIARARELAAQAIRFRAICSSSQTKNSAEIPIRRCPVDGEKMGWLFQTYPSRMCTWKPFHYFA